MSSQSTVAANENKQEGAEIMSESVGMIRGVADNSNYNAEGNNFMRQSATHAYSIFPRCNERSTMNTMMRKTPSRQQVCWGAKAISLASFVVSATIALAAGDRAPLPILYAGRVNELYRSESRIYETLSGTWELELDPKDEGINGAWYDASKKKFSDTVVVPGCLEGQDKGVTHVPITKQTVPGWMRNEVDRPFMRPNWWRRNFVAPGAMRGKKVWLRFGGVCLKADVWLNGARLGTADRAALPFSFDVSGLLRYGAENTLAVRLSQITGKVGMELNDAYGLGVQLAAIHWQGIYRDVELAAHAPERWIEDMYIATDAAKKALSVRVTLGGNAGTDGDACRLDVLDLDGKQIGSQTVPAAGPEIVCALSVPSVALWDDENPRLYRARVTLLRNGAPVDDLSERFGFRDVTYREARSQHSAKTDNGKILLNGVPVYLRGEMYHYHWANSISPQTNRDELRHVLQVYRKFGFNFLRCHTHAPHPEFLDLCDELGLLVHSEPNVISGTFPIPEEVAPDLWTNVIRRDRNHPSVIIWCMGNELGDISQRPLCKRLFDAGMILDATRLVLSSSPGVLLNVPGKPMTPIRHETVKDASYADPAIKNKYRGGFRPWHIMFAEDRATENGLAGYLPRFARNSQRLQARVVKMNIERYRADTLGCGYEHCLVRDGGQFYWGVLDDFADPKSVSAEVLRGYNAATVIVLDEGKTYLGPCWSEQTKLEAPLVLSHFGKSPIAKSTLRYGLYDGQTLIAEGAQELAGVACGEMRKLAPIVCQLPAVEGSKKLTLKATLSCNNTQIANEWPFWVFAKKRHTAPSRKFYLSARAFGDVKKGGFASMLRAAYPFVQEGLPPAGAGNKAVLVTKDWPDALQQARQAIDVLLIVDNSSPVALPGGKRGQGVGGWGRTRAEWKYKLGTVMLDHPLANLITHEGWADLPFRNMLKPCLIDLTAHAEMKGAIPIIMAIPSPKDPEPHLVCHLAEIPFPGSSLLVASMEFSESDIVSSYFLDGIVKWLDERKGPTDASPR
jgi:hypothetical protein